MSQHHVLAEEPLPVISKLLGHGQTGVFLRHVHVQDKETQDATKLVGMVFEGNCGFPN